MNNWISVEDRLPEKGQYVAVWVVPYANPSSAFWANSSYWNNQFEIKGESGLYKNVSHWMEVEPPKQ